MPQAPKRQAVGSPEAGDLNTCDSNYAPISLCESEADDEMRAPWDDVQPSPRSPISITDNDCDKEQDPSLGPCTTRLERISLGADGDARGSIEAKKKEAPMKRTMQDVPERNVFLAELIDGWRIVWKQNPLWTHQCS